MINDIITFKDIMSLGDLTQGHNVTINYGVDGSNLDAITILTHSIEFNAVNNTMTVNIYETTDISIIDILKLLSDNRLIITLLKYDTRKNIIKTIKMALKPLNHNVVYSSKFNNPVNHRIKFRILEAI